MNSLKPFFSRFCSPNWQIRIKKKNDWYFVEITDHFSSLRANKTILYLDLLESVFTQPKKVYLSQKVDQRQWNVGNCKNFAERIQKNFSTNVRLSSDFVSPNMPELDDAEFVLHTISTFNRGMWQEIVRYSMYNLPNFAYSLDSLTDISSNSLFDINKAIVSWFDLETSENELAKILNMIKPMFLTIDGHLFFFISSDRELDKLMGTINHLGEKYSLKPVIKQSTIQS